MLLQVCRGAMERAKSYHKWGALRLTTRTYSVAVGRKKRDVRRETPDERFDKLVGLIKASKGADMKANAEFLEKETKKGKKAPPPPSPLIGNVVDKWCAISRF